MACVAQEDPLRGPSVKGAEMRVVRSVDEVMEAVGAGERARRYGATAMNTRSSRSHTVFRLSLESRTVLSVEAERSSGRRRGGGAALRRRWSTTRSVKVATLNLIDLAGSERASRTKATGTRLREAGHINQSLMSLGTVISQLSKNSQAKHIPYRDSKLTRLLSASLGGNALTALVCCISPTSVRWGLHGRR